MSDLRAALEAALVKNNKEKQLTDTINEWVQDDTQEPDVVPHRFTPTNNVSRETFNTVRDNPNKNHRELVALLTARGFNPSSVSSLLGQMVKQRLVVRNEEGHYATPYKEYVPLKSTAAKPKKKKVTIIKRTYVKSGKYATSTPHATQPTQSGIAALDTHTTLAVAAPAFDAEALLSTLSFPQVLVLYKKIKALLGEAS